MSPGEFAKRRRPVDAVHEASSSLSFRDLFEYLAFDPCRYWYSLLFMDKYNYGGLVVTESNQARDPPENGDLEGEEEAGPANAKAEILMDWNIAEFLPEKLKVRVSAQVIAMA